MTWDFPADPSLKRKALLAAVEKVGPVLEEGAEEAEALATLPGSSVDALYGSGLLALKLPLCMGGAEADPVTQLEVIEAVTRIDTSAGWCLMIGATSVGRPAAFLADEAIERMFPGGRVPKAASVGMSAGEAVPVEGGYTVSGRWSFATGIRHSQWLGAATLVRRDGEGPRERRTVVLPTSQAQVHDNWQVAGLKGTGSNDFSLAGLFVPEAFTWDPMMPPRRGGPLYLMGIPGFVANEHAAFALGAGRRALDEIVGLAHIKERGYWDDKTSLAQSPTFRRAVGESDLRLRAARALAVEVLERGWEAACSGRTPEPRLQAEMRSSAVYATQVALDVVSMAFRQAGGAALYSQSILQRYLRDINAAAQYFMVSESAYDGYGMFALGMTGANPMT